MTRHLVIRFGSRALWGWRGVSFVVVVFVYYWTPQRNHINCRRIWKGSSRPLSYGREPGCLALRSDAERISSLMHFSYTGTRVCARSAQLSSTLCSVSKALSLQLYFSSVPFPILSKPERSLKPMSSAKHLAIALAECAQEVGFSIRVQLSIRLWKMMSSFLYRGSPDAQTIRLAFWYPSTELFSCWTDISQTYI